jgi:glutathione peroxidase
MKKLVMLFLIVPALFADTIYSFTVKDAGGDDINFNSFRGKKILIVNTAEQSLYAKQYGSLEQLYQRYKDSLVVVVFPSNSFNNQSGSNSAIRQSIISNYNAHYLIAEKTNVTGNGASPLFNWLSIKAQNNVMSNPVTGDFQKYLIGTNGKLVAFFAPQLDPMDSILQRMITTPNY